MLSKKNKVTRAKYNKKRYEYKGISKNFLFSSTKLFR